MDLSFGTCGELNCMNSRFKSHDLEEDVGKILVRDKRLDLSLFTWSSIGLTRVMNSILSSGKVKILSFEQAVLQSHQFSAPCITKKCRQCHQTLWRPFPYCSIKEPKLVRNWVRKRISLLFN